MSEDGRSLRDGLSSLRDEAGKPSSPKASIPSATVTANEREALLGLAGTHPFEEFRTFKGVANRCALAPHLIRRTVRSVARKGLAVYSNGLWDDDGRPAGAGYALTDAGQKLSDSLGIEAPYHDY